MVNECDFSPWASWLDDVSDSTESLVVHLGPNDLIREGRSPSEVKALLSLTIRELKQRFPKIDYIESVNEPDWVFHGRQVRVERTDPILEPDELYTYYVPYYEAVNEVNEELGLRVPGERIKVGGPTLTGMNETWMKAFLDGYAADTNPHKRLDFISYHGYGVFSDDFQSFDVFKSDPSEVATQRERLEEWLKERHITKHIPTFVTETGVYPGGSGDSPDPKDDAIRQAAGMASLHYWWAGQPRTTPFNWVVRHGSNERKDQLVTRAQDGPLADTFTPYGNTLLMQSMMKDERVEATSDSLNAGQGVYAIASKDRSGASIMVWNYQSVNEGRFLTTIDLSRLPANLKHGMARQTIYRIDETTSNYWSNPDQGNLQQVDEQIVDLSKNCCTIVDLEPNALVLILLEPVDGPNGHPGSRPGD